MLATDHNLLLSRQQHLNVCLRVALDQIGYRVLEDWDEPEDRRGKGTSYNSIIAANPAKMLAGHLSRLSDRCSR